MNMNKKEVIARRILGWSLNSQDKWFDVEKGIFINNSDFQPEKNIDDAMLIVERLKLFGFTYETKGESEVCFNDVCATGETLAEAITNAAYSLAEVKPISDAWF